VPAIPQRQDLSQILRWHPWNGGDPAPEIYQIILELERSVQLQVAGAILQTQINVGEAHLEGLKQIQGIIGKAKG
jgi:hypothetical protein